MTILSQRNYIMNADMSEWTRWTTYNDNSLTKKVAGGLNLGDDGVKTRSPQVGFVSEVHSADSASSMPDSHNAKINEGKLGPRGISVA